MWYTWAQVDVLARCPLCLGVCPEDRVAAATPLPSVTVIILEHSGLSIALCFFLNRLIESSWSAGFCFVLVEVKHT